MHEKPTYFSLIHAALIPPFTMFGFFTVLKSSFLEVKHRQSNGMCLVPAIVSHESRGKEVNKALEDEIPK